MSDTPVSGNQVTPKVKGTTRLIHLLLADSGCAGLISSHQQFCDVSGRHYLERNKLSKVTVSIWTLFVCIK